ncbi:esterase/lipase [Paenibacillus sp. DS2015]|uniref:alpha/beta hydrolase n=1 Tax=Paenibacillus sp. DS2015 TaxID=3373917 RepID=UPI003D1EF3A7
MTVCLLIHGFTGGEHEIAPLADFLQEHGCKTRTFTLKGHGGSRKDMLSAGRADWIEGAEHELLNLLDEYNEVHLIGFSTGSLIAAHLSVKYSSRIGTITMLSTPVFPLNRPEIMKTLLDVHMLKAYVRNFLVTPLRATREFYRIVNESFDIYEEVKSPVLIVQGASDHLVKPKSGPFLHERLGSMNKKLLMIEKSGHLVCHCSDHKTVFEAVASWVNAHPK